MVCFFVEDVPFDTSQLSHVPQWLSRVAQYERVTISDLSYIICSDSYLLSINQRYLQHDYYTDIITFGHSDEVGTVEGDLFISVDRIYDNAQLLHLPPLDELLRVVVHGFLHLCGYDDATDKSKQTMRHLEDRYLCLYRELF